MRITLRRVFEEGVRILENSSRFGTILDTIRERGTGEVCNPLK